MSFELRDSDPVAACSGKHRVGLGREKVSRNVFRCPHCGGWHLTHAKRRAERAPISKRKTGGFRG